MDLAALVRPEVRALRAYHLDQVPCRFKLDQNEVPWDLPRRLKREVAQRLEGRDWARYPDFHGDELRRALGEHHGHPWQGVLVGNGSNELLEVAVAAFTLVGGEILLAQPTFTLYRMFALRAGSGAKALPPRPDLRLPLAEIERAVKEDPRRPVVLCSPNNPTGDAAPPEWVESLLERLEAPLLLDNAYGEFCRHDYRPLLARHSHLLLFRTFSKAWSLGGMRLGYVLAHPDLAAELLKIKLPYNLGHGGLVTGQVVLKHSAVMRRRVAALTALRRLWVASLARFGFEVFPSEANFLLARVPAARLGLDVDLDVDAVRRGLAERGILVRDVSAYPGLAGCMRVSVGSKRALRAVENALQEMVGQKSGRQETTEQEGTEQDATEQDATEQGVAKQGGRP